VSSSQLHNSVGLPRWGLPPWTIDFVSQDEQPLPKRVDFAVVGGGFTGLTAAAWLRHIAPDRKVALFESSRIGAGSSGHTGGMTLSETAAGHMPGLGDVLAGLSNTLRELQVDCDLTLPGAVEIGRQGVLPNSAIAWNDSGSLGVTAEVPGGTLDPGKLLSGMARAAVQRGVMLFENARVDSIEMSDSTVLKVRGEAVRAGCVLLATNAESLELSALAGQAESKFTLAVATEALSEDQLGRLGLAAGKPFYTIDLPYLWGRTFHGNRVIFGSGLVHLEDWRDLLTLDVTKGEAAELLSDLEKRVHALHPALAKVHITHRWGGPILIANKWEPIFRRHTQYHNVLVLGAYSGHGVALSVYLGAWAAEAMLGKRDLPEWQGQGKAAD
jgi:glycine/D-amino acid oxidase-like deaminating enzyme